MKTNIDWIRDFVEVDMAPDRLAELLTMAGLEVDSVTPVAPAFDGVVVAEILERRPHPNADRLSICRVSDGQDEHEIVCGAPNAAVGIKVPFAPVGTELPGGFGIKSTRIRGVESGGMLCSAKELGLAEDADGLLVLDATAAIGSDLRTHLALNDHVLEIDLTPNRGDCFSVLGIAREIAAREGHELDESQDCIEPEGDAIHEVELVDTAACPRFAGRVIGGMDNEATSPDWLCERLRRAGLRPIHPVVDVTNYVMLELGQPLHAYRLDRLQGPIRVRFAEAGEKLTLLDESTLTLDDDALVIADDSGAIGLAGIMGGLSTAVDADTCDIFLESAFFSPKAIQGRARRYGMHTDASVRFERGVDPTGQERAIERATSLLLEISGGTAGPIVVAEDSHELPQRAPVPVRHERVGSLLGMDIDAGEIETLLVRLGMQVEPDEGGWQVTPPSYRFDIAIEEDLIEELGRMIGYDRIPVVAASSEVHLGRDPEGKISIDTLTDCLVARGYREIVSYSFTDAAAQASLTGTDSAVPLTNPISRDLGVLRSTLWTGLLAAARLNFSRQVSRCRLFEVGTVFEPAGDSVCERTQIAGLLTGPRLPAHWEGEAPDADFFDLKNDVEALLDHWVAGREVSYVTETHHALNPSKTSAILFQDRRVGWIGELHPRLQNEYDFKQAVVLFEIELRPLGEAPLPRYKSLSRYPSSRRDLAVVVDDEVTVADITKLAAEELGDSLQRYHVFDLYRGEGVGNGRKSVGIGLILQNASRTLNDEETDDMIDRVMRRLEHELGATIRN